MDPETDRLPPVNNAIYETLGERWYAAMDDPLALLRAESRLRNPWIDERLQADFGARPCSILEVGCGGGFLCNYLATRGHRVTGLDAARDALRIAAAHDQTGTVQYHQGSALALPYPDASFDAVCAMDFLEHVEQPGQVIAEAARVLTPSGRFFFHTFNRNWLAWLIVIKGVEWFVRNTPPDLHVLHLFIKPTELTALCRRSGMEVAELRGSRPRLGRALWQLLRTGVVPPDFAFAFSRSILLGYTGWARKIGG